ncbi:hypothetical protein OY671_012500, partial [Metschnikowia pulcherrima]
TTCPLSRETCPRVRWARGAMSRPFGSLACRPQCRSSTPSTLARLRTRSTIARRAFTSWMRTKALFSSSPS